MPILVDLSQIIMGGVIVNLTSELSKPGVDAKNLIQHMVYTSLLGIKKKFGKEYGEMILCADSDSYWRRDYFQWYKGHRKHDKEKSDIDWTVVYSAIDVIKKDLNEYFPYKILEVPNCEADDIIACLTKYLQTNETKTSSLFIEDPQSIMIVSSDGDFPQLQIYKGVKQFDNQRKKFLVSKNPKKDLLEKIASGDTGDNIANILTSDMWSQLRAENADEKMRQKSMKAALLEDLSERGALACTNEEQRRNYIRNENLISFDKIPTHIYDSIIDSYKGYVKKGSTMKLMNYFTTNRMRLLFGSVSEF